MWNRSFKIREFKEEQELKMLHPKATFSKFSKGRPKKEKECDLRTPFERDRDRILHSKSFRRLKHKTQVFLAPRGDHYRTRLTHTLEVSQIARSIARALRLNEDLTEAVALGHDLGHTPFGHAGEEVLNELLEGGFKHAKQSLRVVDFLEREGKGLNLTHEVREGILKHSKGLKSLEKIEKEEIPSTLEAQIVRLADVIAYVNHDIDDAIRARLITVSDLPKEVKKGLGETHGQRIETLIKGVIAGTQEVNYEKVVLLPELLSLLEILRDFLVERVYFSKVVRKEFEKAKKILYFLFEYYMKNFEKIEFLVKLKKIFPEEREEVLVADYISGMTDRFAINEFNRLFIPQPWKV